MKLTVLGRSGGFPAAGGATSGYLLEIDGSYILIDCGSGVLANLFRFIQLEELAAIILTHLHYDHISDIQVLKYAIDLSRKHGRDIRPIPVFAPATPELVVDSLQGDGDLIIGQITNGMAVPLFGATVRFYLMEHPVETYGLSIEKAGRKLALTADTVPCANLQPLLQNADLAVMDAGSIERLRLPRMMHVTAAECATLAAAGNVQQLLLSHLLPLLDPAEILAEAAQIYPAAELAWELVVYDI